MKRLTGTLLAAGLILAAAPAFANDMGDQGRAPRAARAFDIQAQLSQSERDNYRSIFADLRMRNWASAAGRLDGMRSGPLHDLARAMLYTMPGSPPVELEPLRSLLERGRHLPQAGDLARLATVRGATSLPDIPQQQRLAGLPGQPRRARARAIRGDAVADRLEPLIQPLLVADQPSEAEAIFAARAADLSPEARTAFQQRIAWVYFLNGRDAEARRIADEARRGPTEWALHAEWVAGLSAWRMRDCAAASAHFATVAARSGDVELSAAGH
ncbi:MAG: hypothetical protein ACT4N8_15820 [Sphingosinicella sp.]|uniref:hypothetical protein n=1 Tax=Sphingosinicella sp. TaxID=1917971 RepID=UPI004037F9D8